LFSDSNYDETQIISAKLQQPFNISLIDLFFFLRYIYQAVLCSAQGG